MFEWHPATTNTNRRLSSNSNYNNQTKQASEQQTRNNKIVKLYDIHEFLSYNLIQTTTAHYKRTETKNGRSHGAEQVAHAVSNQTLEIDKEDQSMS